ncbi:hypothetical protein, partial [Bacteroides caecigallinarum]|uniref:hypothetical protein n=1 Tax=Bacteroides caecigallinarum TaxID=1411144 RepID=UPI0019583236
NERIYSVFQALFKANLAVKLDALSRSEWVGMLRFRHYHVDVLKSPIPIDFGLNIHGAVDNLKFNIKKCKYKDLYNRDNGLKFLNNTYSKMELLRKEISKKINL